MSPSVVQSVTVEGNGEPGPKRGRPGARKTKPEDKSPVINGPRRGRFTWLPSIFWPPSLSSIGSPAPAPVAVEVASETRQPQDLLAEIKSKKPTGVLDDFLQMTFPTSRCRCCGKKNGLMYAQKCANRSYRYFDPTDMISFEHIYGLEGFQIYWLRVIDDLQAQIERLRAKQEEEGPGSEDLEEVIQFWTKAIVRAEKQVHRPRTKESGGTNPRRNPAQRDDMCVRIEVPGPVSLGESRTRQIWARRMNWPCLGAHGRRISEHERQQRASTCASMAEDEFRFVKIGGRILRMLKKHFNQRWLEKGDRPGAVRFGWQMERVDVFYFNKEQKRSHQRRSRGNPTKSAAREFYERPAYLHKPSSSSKCWLPEELEEDEEERCRGGVVG